MCCYTDQLIHVHGLERSYVSPCIMQPMSLFMKPFLAHMRWRDKSAKWSEVSAHYWRIICLRGTCGIMGGQPLPGFFSWLAKWPGPYVLEFHNTGVLQLIELSTFVTVGHAFTNCPLRCYADYSYVCTCMYARTVIHRCTRHTINCLWTPKWKSACSSVYLAKFKQDGG